MDPILGSPALPLPMGRPPQVASWLLAQPPSPQARILALEGYMVLCDPKDASLVVFSLTAEGREGYRSDVLQSTGSQLTSPVIAGRHLVWGSENGVWGVPLYLLTTAHPQLLPKRFSGEAVLEPLMSDGEYVMWRTESGLRAYDPLRDSAWRLQLPAAAGLTCYLLGHRLAGVAQAGALSVFDLPEVASDAETEMVQVARTTVALPHPVTALHAVNPQQLLGLMGDQPVRFLLRADGHLVVAPVTLSAPQPFNRIIRAEGLNASSYLLAHDAGWEVFDGDSGMVAAGAGKHVALIERRPEMHVRSKMLFAARLAQDTALFHVELYDLLSKSRVKFVPGFQNVYHAAFDSRWLTVIGQLDDKVQIATYDLCKSV
jgi:hypothetical protein